MRPKLKAVTDMQQDDDMAKPSMALGDHVYYKHPEHGATHGVVAALGKHGFRADSEGGEHEVRWSDFLGHRKRVDRRLTIVDRGEDGSIMQDEDGKRVFVRGELPDYEVPMEKAMAPVAVPPAPTLLEKAQVVRELAAAGFGPAPEYIRETFGAHFAALPEVERLSAAQGAQSQELSAAVALLAERMATSDQMVQALLDGGVTGGGNGRRD